VVSGSGFTASHNSLGNYTVSFATSFPVAPVVLASAVDSGGNDHVITVRSISTTGFDVIFMDTFEGDNISGLQDNAFTFVVLGSM
jgi:hypothetical protein